MLGAITPGRGFESHPLRLFFVDGYLGAAPALVRGTHGEVCEVEPSLHRDSLPLFEDGQQVVGRRVCGNDLPQSAVEADESTTVADRERKQMSVGDLAIPDELG